jgi:RIO kinase 1
MDKKNNIEFFDELDAEGILEAYLQLDGQRLRNPKGRLSKKLEGEERAFVESQQRVLTQKRESKKNETDARLFVRAQEISREFKFTYKAARFEEAWLLDSLFDIADHQLISDVLRKVKAGKEASVYLCRAGRAIHADLVAAKVYRPRILRNLRNDGLYRQGRADLDDEGRGMLDDGQLHAMEKKTEYGRELLHQSWIAYEFTSLQDLFKAGADVPEPFTMAHNAILMGFVGDLSASAPTLNEMHLDKSEARQLFDRVLNNIDIMLSHERIHGDLSAYNILYWDGEISIIDFPQVVSPRVNQNAFSIFQRDVKRVCEYFAKQGIASDPRRLAEELWVSRGYRVKVEHEEE